MIDGTLSKVVIHAFTDKRLTAKNKEFPLFTVPVNPETYSQNFKVEYDAGQGQGTQRTDPRFKSTAPEQLSLEFVLDGTGTIEGYEPTLAKKPVREQVSQLLNTVYNMAGEIHKPNFLKVTWDKLTFDCVLTSLDIKYTLFHRNGEPLRAKISATFLDYVEQEKRVKREDKRSPDLSHIRAVTSADKLPLLCHDQYGDPGFYLQVARVNRLTSPRGLVAGQELTFPPIDKTGS